jgi:hypothetical protein
VGTSRELTYHREPKIPLIVGGNDGFIIRNETLKKMYRSPSVVEIIDEGLHQLSPETK